MLICLDGEQKKYLSSDSIGNDKEEYWLVSSDINFDFFFWIFLHNINNIDSLQQFYIFQLTAILKII